MDVIIFVLASNPNTSIAMFELRLRIPDINIPKVGELKIRISVQQVGFPDLPKEWRGVPDKRLAATRSKSNNIPLPCNIPIMRRQLRQSPL